MDRYLIGDKVDLIRFQIKEGNLYENDIDIYGIKFLIQRNKLKRNDLIISYLEVKITDTITHPHDYFGYVGVVTSMFDFSGNEKSNIQDLSNLNIVLKCQGTEYRRHRCFIHGLNDYNILDHYWVSRKAGKFRGGYYSLNFIKNNIFVDYPEVYKFILSSA